MRTILFFIVMMQPVRKSQIEHNLPGVLFSDTLAKNQLKLNRTLLSTLQINVGKLCNQVCLHCHVEAGPKRKEIMSSETVDRILFLLGKSDSIHTIDLTGGAPELNPSFKKIVERTTALGKKVIDRCNLTVFFEDGQKDLPDFLARHKVLVVASLPCYSEANVDKQRGKGVFGKSIDALLALNRKGYGTEGSGLEIDLVYNPVGIHLPPDQEKLELEYKKRLMDDFGIRFNKLFCITNMPVKRYLEDLLKQNKLNEYMELLINNFNVSAAKNVMCRSLLSVSWDGKLYDCDFNQMLDVALPGGAKTIYDIESFSEFNAGEISFENHCYGCAAGSGSSCTGSTS